MWIFEWKKKNLQSHYVIIGCINVHYLLFYYYTEYCAFRRGQCEVMM